MTITNGYATLAEFKSFARITSTDATDDVVIEYIVESSSRFIDGATGRTFYSRAAETRYFDVPASDYYLSNGSFRGDPSWSRLNTLYLDDDLLSIDTGGLINGDGTVITASNYILLPNNLSPKYGIRLKYNASSLWTFSSAGEYLQVISVKGAWGFSSTAPTDIKLACLMIANDAYKTRFVDMGQAGTARITAAGVVITPDAIPRKAAQILDGYRRMVDFLEA